MIGCAVRRSCDVVGNVGTGRAGAALADDDTNAAPTSCVAPAAWKYAATASKATTTAAKYFFKSESTGFGGAWVQERLR